MYKIMYVGSFGDVCDSICPPFETLNEAINHCNNLNNDGFGNDFMFHYPVFVKPKKRLIDYPADIVGKAVANMKRDGLSLNEIVELLKGEVEE